MKRLITIDLPYDTLIGTPVVPDNIVQNADSVQVIVNAVFPIYRAMWELYHTYALEPMSGTLANTITNTFSRLCRERAICTGLQIYSVDLPLDTISTQLKCMAVHKSCYNEIVMKFSVTKTFATELSSIGAICKAL